MLGGADNPNGELLSYIIGADNFSFDSFIPGKTGFPSTIVAPRQMVQMPEPSRYAVVWLPSFSSRNWSSI